MIGPIAWLVAQFTQPPITGFGHSQDETPRTRISRDGHRREFALVAVAWSNSCSRSKQWESRRSICHQSGVIGQKIEWGGLQERRQCGP